MQPAGSWMLGGGQSPRGNASAATHTRGEFHGTNKGREGDIVVSGG